VHFNVYIDDETGQQLSQTAELVGESRNALIRKAVREWLERQGEPQWPVEVLSFEGMAVMPPFEASRDRLSPPPWNPF
jgi:hypothetical protein